MYSLSLHDIFTEFLLRRIAEEEKYELFKRNQRTFNSFVKVKIKRRKEFPKRFNKISYRRMQHK